MTGGKKHPLSDKREEAPPVRQPEITDLSSKKGGWGKTYTKPVMSKRVRSRPKAWAPTL